MSLLIDKAKAETRFVLTISEAAGADNCVLHLKGGNDNRDLVVPLGQNLSQHKSRYDLFVLDTALFQGLKLEDYRYTITRQGETTPLESGVARVIDSSKIEDDQFVTRQQSAILSADDFITR